MRNWKLFILTGVCVFMKYVVLPMQCSIQSLCLPVSGPLCYECQRIPYPRDCDRIRRCGPHERCYTSQYISTSGAIWYDTGCFPNERCLTKRNIANITNATHVNTAVDVLQNDVKQNDDIRTCDMCCNGDFCNSHGCGSQPLSSLTTRGPVCFSCHQQPSQSSCEIVNTCKKGEKCYLLPQSHTFDIIYTTGCMTDAQCDTLQAMPSLVGKRNVQTKCGGCCDRDYCNQNCTSLHSLPVYPSASVSFTSPTMSTLARETNSKSISTKASSTTLTTLTIMTRTTTSTLPLITPISPYIDQASCHSRGYTFVPKYSLCYKLYRYKHTWQDAREYCIRDGGDLVVFDNQGERDYFDLLTRGIYASVDQYERRFWVGATDQEIEQYWVWVDGSDVSRNYFHPDEPNNAYSGENCAAMTYFHTDNHTWLNDDKCDTHSDFMCQLKLKPHSMCKNSDFHYTSNLHTCYKVYKDNPMNWSDAQRFCEQKSGHLLILENKDTETYFASIHFYQLSDHELTHRYWVGGKDFHHQRHFTWINDQPLSATLSWNPGEPNNYHNNEYCLDLTSESGQVALNDDDCAKKLYFICQE